MLDIDILGLIDAVDINMVDTYLVDTEMADIDMVDIVHCRPYMAGTEMVITAM